MRTIAAMLLSQGFANESAQIGDYDPELGWGLPKWVKKAASKAKSAASTAYRYGKKGVTTAARKGFQVMTFPLQMQLKAAIQASRFICAAPQPALQLAAKATGIPTATVPAYCNAMRVNNMAQIKKLLPDIIKLGASLAASGSFPAAAPAMRVLQFVPLSLIPGLGEDDRYVSAQLAQWVEELGDAQIEDALGMGMGLGLGATTVSTGKVVAIAFGLGAVVLGMAYMGKPRAGAPVRY